MKENGSFRKKAGFTIAGNSLVRDSKLSLKAKGLYLLIMSYITLDSLDLTKMFLLKKCSEGEKAFNSAWNELKETGYLKAHFTPGKQGWRTEYELLDEPKDGAHTFYHASNGDITNTNLTVTRTNPLLEHDIQRTPQNGIYAESSNAKVTNAESNNAEGVYAQGNNANVGNNITLPCKTYNKTYFNTQSINLESGDESSLNDGLSENELLEEIEEELSLNRAVPYTYNSDGRRMEIAIRLLTDWYDLTPKHFESRFEFEVFYLAVDCLIEMACADDIRMYKGAAVSYAKVIDKINEIIARDVSLFPCLDEAIADYIKKAEEEEIYDKRKFMMSVIWNSFSTYRVKHESYFARTYGK